MTPQVATRVRVADDPSLAGVLWFIRTTSEADEIADLARIQPKLRHPWMFGRQSLAQGDNRHRRSVARSLLPRRHSARKLEDYVCRVSTILTGTVLVARSATFSRDMRGLGVIPSIRLRFRQCYSATRCWAGRNPILKPYLMVRPIDRLHVFVCSAHRAFPPGAGINGCRADGAATSYSPE